MKNVLTIELSSDLDYQGMVVNICYNMETIASINYDKGIDNIEIHLLPTFERYIFPLTDFTIILEKAKQLAIKGAKEDAEKDL